MRGNRVHYVSGWDCHGMPIELKALEDAVYSSQKLTPLQIRDKGLSMVIKLWKDRSGQIV